MQILTFPIQPPHSAPTAKATLTAYLLDGISSNPDRLRPVILICPGGGYSRVSDREAQPIAMQFLSMGCHAMVLDYSIAPNRFPQALTELASAVALIRAHAEEWMADPQQIILCGFSAGGHLACSLGAFWNRPFLSETLGLPSAQLQPNGQILCYPVISSGSDCHIASFEHLLGGQATDPEARHGISLEHQVGPHTPKTFLWHTWVDQTVPVENSLLLAQSLLKAGVSLELHIYPAGLHGLSLATAEVSTPDGNYIEPQCQSWMTLAKSWIEHF